jgi:hypothetical protein
MADKTVVEQLKERFAQHARARIPFNPLDTAEIVGANVDRLKLGMETFGWSDFRFVTQDQALTNGWTIPRDAASVQVTVRNQSNGTISERRLFNAQSVLGMPTLDAMLNMSEAELRQMRGEVEQQAEGPLPVVASAHAAGPAAPKAEMDESELEDEIEIGPARQPEKTQAHQGAELVSGAHAPVSEAELPSARGEQATSRKAEVDGVAPADEFAVFAPYWRNGLHNFEGLELAKQINQMVDAQRLAKNKAEIARLVATYPEARQYGVDVVPRETYLGDPHRKANVSEPEQLAEGELVRDKHGEYRPKAGGVAVLKDKGTSLVLKDKSDLAYRGAMELALAKGWKSIELNGKPKMMAQAWLEAQVLGLDVVNYKPTEKDRENLAKRMAQEAQKRAAAAARVAEQGPQAVEIRPIVDATGKQVMATVTHSTERVASPSQLPATPTVDAAAPPAAVANAKETTRTVTRVGDVVRDDLVTNVVANAGNLGQPATSDIAAIVDRETANAKVELSGDEAAIAALEGRSSKSEIAGARLIAHGHAPYANDPKNSSSYFVDVEVAEGVVKTLWGKDLERSIAKAGALPGDMIAVEEQGRVPVEVDGKTHSRVSWSTSLVSRGSELAQPAVNAAKVVSSGLHVGKIVEIKDGRVGQKAGRDPSQLVWHDIAKLGGKVPALGEMAEIQYGSEGLGKFKQPERVQELSR